MKTPYGQTRGLYVYVANKSIHRFRVQKTTCNHYANFFADVKVIGQLFSQNSLNESLLFYNFSVKTIRMKVCYFTLLQLKRLWENIVIGQLFSQNSLNESLLFYNFSVKTIRMKVCYFTLLQLKRLWENIAKYLILSCTCFCSIPCWRALMAWKARARIMLISADNQVILKNTNRLNVSLNWLLSIWLEVKAS